jgi:hypothetical protein
VTIGLDADGATVRSDLYLDFWSHFLCH